MAETLYLIDGHSQIYRAYYAPFRDLTSPSGEPTRATYVFCSMLLKFLAEQHPEYLAMAVDGSAEKLKRRQVYPEYKVTRKPMPDDLLPQVRRIMQIVEAMGIPRLSAEGYEADDILATLAERFASPKMNVVLISRDKDLDQLVGGHVVLHDPMRNRTYDAAAIEAEKGYRPDQAVDAQALMGDATDNVPGVRGIGPKTAAKLIAQYGSLEGVLEHASELSPKLRDNIQAAAESVGVSAPQWIAAGSPLELARRLVTLDRHVPLELDLEAIRFHGLRGEAVRPIFVELGFNRLLDQLDSLGVAGEERVEVKAAAAAGGQTTAADFDYAWVNTSAGLDELIARLSGVRKLAVDTETTSLHPMWAELVGVSLAWRPGQAVYLPVKAPLGTPTLSLEELRAKLGPILADATIEKVGQNLKYDLIVLSNAGMAPAGEMFDTMIAAHVLDSTRPTYALDALAAEFLNHRSIPIEELLGRGRNKITMDAVPLEKITQYSCEDADLALRLAEVLEDHLSQEGLNDLFERLEMPLMPVLADMEQTGIIVDPQALGRMKLALSRQADLLRDRIILAAGHPFNPDSPKQLATVLFEELNLPVLRRAQTGPSTDSAVLEELAAVAELPGLVLDYRKLTKLLNTYVAALGQSIHPQTRRVHTSFSQTSTATGRLSSSDPNLQNIPVRSEEGREIRSAFLAAQGWLLLSADYSQVELRVLAHLCEDPTLIAAFQADQDIHRIVAAEVFGVRPEDVTPQQRARAKTVNFGIIYGQTAYGLAVTLRISRQEAGDFIKRYHKRFPRIEEFLRSCVDAAKANGYVETIFKRRRRIAGLDARSGQTRSQAERLAINSVVQGSAADLIKQAMVNIAIRTRREKRPSRMLLQIHDELLFEVPQEAVGREKEMIVSEMSSAIRLRVPITVDVGVGPDWKTAK